MAFLILGVSMSIIDRIEEEQKLLFKEHTIISMGGKTFCSECKLNIWSDDFPEYCQGNTTYLDVGEVSCENGVYEINAEILHLHEKINLDIASIDGGIRLEISKEAMLTL